MAQAEVPFWVLLIGALGIALGLTLFGPKLIRTVGSKITKLNRIRAFCVTLSAAITVILASALGLPVSSTHIAIGALFGVGFLREYPEHRRRNGKLAVAEGADDEVEPLGEAIETPSASEFVLPDNPEYANADEPDPDLGAAPESLAEIEAGRLAKAARKAKKKRRRFLVRRGHVVTIVAAWVITVPASALLAAVLAHGLLALNLAGLP